MNSKTININKCYYHAFSKDEKVFKNIIQQGIKCKLLQGHIDLNSTYNGTFYISLYKIKSNDKVMKIIQERPCIILDEKIKPIHTKKGAGIFSNTPLPIRVSPYENEYQKFFYISPKHFLGIGLNLEDERTIKQKYEDLRNMLIWLKEIQKDIDFYDISTGKIINKKV